MYSEYNLYHAKLAWSTIDRLVIQPVITTATSEWIRDTHCGGTLGSGTKCHLGLPKFPSKNGSNFDLSHSLLADGTAVQPTAVVSQSYSLYS